MGVAESAWKFQAKRDWEFELSSSFGPSLKPRPKLGWELFRVQTLALVWPETLMRSQRLSCDLIKFEPALESRQEFSLVFFPKWWQSTRVEENYHENQLSCLFFPGFIHAPFEQPERVTFTIRPDLDTNFSCAVNIYGATSRTYSMIFYILITCLLDNVLIL